MEIDFNLVKHTALFNGINEIEIDSMLTCMSAYVVRYKKGQMIYRVGDSVTLLGEVLSGKIHLIKEDFWGNKSILSELGVGQLFGEAYALSQSVLLELGVLAAESAEILFLDAKRMMTTCSSACKFHSKLIRNLLAVTAQNNLLMTRKMEYISHRTIRGKLLSYLSAESQYHKSAVFSISFNRQQLADYLYVDRSAMSNELCKLRDEGILKFERNNFELLC